MNYPKNETVWLQCRDAQGRILYIITSPPDRREYRLYMPEPDGSWRRWGKDTSAGVLERRFLARRAS